MLSHCLAILAPFLTAPLQALSAELVPAGSINGVQSGPGTVFIVDDGHPELLRYVTRIRDQFVPEAEILGDLEALDVDFAGRTPWIYGTPDNAWLKLHAERLPFAFGEGRLTLHGREADFEGEHLRLIGAIRNPDDWDGDGDGRALLYVAASPADLMEINAVYHGPTEWLVADGRRTLATGEWRGAPLSTEQLRGDLTVLRERLEQVHPIAVEGLPGPLAERLDDVAASLDRPMTRSDFRLRCARALAALGDAHSTIDLGGAEERFDLPVTWLAKGPVVHADTGALRRGDRILSIGGRTTDELFAGLIELVPHETPVWVRAKADDLIARAAILGSLGAAVGDSVAVELERAGQRVEVEVGRTTEMRPRPRYGSSSNRSRPWVGFEIEREAGYGLFWLDSCRPNDQYDRVVADFFAAVAESGVRAIAIDLRENSGGSSQVVNRFLRYLELDEYRDFGGSVRLYKEDGRLMSQAPGVSTNPPPEPPAGSDVAPPPRFDGDLFALTSPRTFSSGTWFAVVLADNDLARVLGEPTGSAPSAYGDLVTFTLPASGIAFQLSHKQFIRPRPERDPASGPAVHLEPHRMIEITAADLAAGRDPVREALREEVAALR